MENDVTKGGIVRSWTAPARAANFRNFRFWFVVVFGALILAFAIRLLALPLMGGISHGRELGPALVFGGLLAWIGVSILGLRRSRAYDWGMGFGGLAIASALLIFVVTIIPMNDPNSAQYGKPPPMPFIGMFGMAAVGAAVICLCNWMRDRKPSENP